METTYITLTAREILVEGDAVQRVSGGGARQLVCVRKAARAEEKSAGKVIDMAAWKAAREVETVEDELWYEEPEQICETPAAPIRRGGHSALTPDLWASAAVIGVMAVLLVRILIGF